jgi:aspartate aminotransferase
MQPQLSTHFSSRQPSAIRTAQIKFSQRQDNVIAINTAIGNVSLPMHPAMQKRMFNLGAKNSPFKNGVVKYSATVGMKETNQAFLNIIAASNFETKNLYSQITDGGSQAMELIIIGTCGPAGTNKRPLMLLDAAYTNYASMAQRLGRKTISISRKLQNNGDFSMPDFTEIEKMIEKNNPGALVVIPYDNPTGQFIDLDNMARLAQLCVKHNIWLISDEAYRELHYTNKKTSSIWGITEKMAPGITGRRISIESTSKVWNACGLRIGAIITDSQKYHQKSVAENTANLCSSVIGQYIFGSIAHESHQDLQAWFSQQRKHYHNMLEKLTLDLKEKLPGIIVSSPEASIYSVVDVREIVPKDFNAASFVDYCSSKGKVKIDGDNFTLLVSPMAGFYTIEEGNSNPGKTQMRIAYVESPENMAKVPHLFTNLLNQYLAV